MSASTEKTTKLTVGMSEVLLSDFDRSDLAKLGKQPAMATVGELDAGTARQLLT